MDVISYLLGKKAGGGTPINNQNKDITITENGTTTVSADAGYTGLGTVGVTTNVQPDLESKSVTITENGTTTVTPTTGKDGLSEVEVTTNVPTSGPDLSEYFGDTIQSGTSYVPGFLNMIKKLPGPLTISGGSLSRAFARFRGTKIPKIIGNPTNLELMFQDCPNIISLDLTTMNTSNVVSTNYMFAACSNLETVNMSGLDFGHVQNVVEMFNTCPKLTNLFFGYDLGKYYSSAASASSTNYTLDLSGCNLLTHDSLMSVINGLYDIASAGVQPQKLILGSTNLAKLSQAEKDMVTAKGWNLS